MQIEGTDEMARYASRFVGGLAQRSDSATVVTLSGELGAGKTTLAQGITRALGVRETVASPTFVLEKKYELSGQKWARLIHIDAYRLVEARELEVLGWHEILSDPGNIILIEWPEMVAELIPAHATRVAIEGDGDTREVIVA